MSSPGLAADLWLGVSLTLQVIDCTGASITPTRCSAFTTPNDTRSGSRESFEEVVSQTSSPDWRVRWHAVDAIGIRREPLAIPALVRVVLHDDNSHPRWRALWAIGTIDASGSSAVPAFGRALRDPDPSVVLNAAVALAYFGRAEARPTLVRGLLDADPFRRWEAAFSLRKIGCGSLAGELQRALSNETDPRVRKEITRVLSGIGNSDSQFTR